jgi:monofunctional biosynthetic peptidoglycan transglycosylase
MERSDPPRPAAADPAAAKPEPQKPAAEGEAAPAPENAENLPPPPESDAFGESEPEAVERTHFEELERETTQPVRRYGYQPASPQDITPADIGHAVDYEVSVEHVAVPHQEEQPQTPSTDPITETPFEPWPDPLQTTRPHAREPAREDAPADYVGELPSAFDGSPRAPPIEEHVEEPEAPQPSTPSEPDAAAEFFEPADPSPAHSEPQPRAFEPMPFEVPPPFTGRSAEPAPPAYEPPHVEPDPIEPAPAAPVSYELGYSGPLAPEPEPASPAPEPPAYEPAYVEQRTHEPQPEAEPEPDPAPAPAPPLTLRHDVAAAWSPSPATRREPTFRRPEPVLPPATTVPEPELAPAGRRDYRDLFGRAVRVGVLAFCGWFVAVLVLIAAYRFVNPPFSMLMAQQWLSGTPIDKQWAPLERISPNLARAVIVAEDGRFCQHWGVDFIEAANAIRRASDGYPRGASTITMQVAKNLFLLPVKSYLRKIVEIPLTFAIELAWPKRRILEVYLNIVELGPGIFGAEAASQAHFGRSAAGLSPRQAAQLAVSLPNPIVRDAGAPGPRTAHRASVIQARAARTREASACVDGGR